MCRSFVVDLKHHQTLFFFPRVARTLQRLKNPAHLISPRERHTFKLFAQYDAARQGPTTADAAAVANDSHKLTPQSMARAGHNLAPFNLVAGDDAEATNTVQPAHAGLPLKDAAELPHGEATHLAPTPAQRPLGQAGKYATGELADAAAMLAADPAMVARLSKVFEKLEPKVYPQEERQDDSGAPGVAVAGHLRAVVKDLVQKPKEGFHRDEPFYVIDLARPIVQMARFKKNLPRVQPFYAVKCNPTSEMIQILSALGASFDCASLAEIESVVDTDLATRGAEKDVIFANPAKLPHHMEEAEKKGVRMTTFDNEFELEKIAKYMPSARAVLRIATDDSAAQCELSSKFGAPMEITEELLIRARELGIAVVGCSFHVGSGNSNPNAFTEAIANARTVFDQGHAHGHAMTLLDIGGGFPGSQPAADSKDLSFEEICEVIRPKLAECFPEGCGVEIIAEPGRFFAESTYALALNVHSRRIIVPRNNSAAAGGDSREFQYYLSDGVYGSFNCILFDHQSPKIHLMVPDEEAAIRTTTLFGPTCDGLDCIMKRQPFPELDVGEWLFVSDFGAYTIAARTAFNGYLTKRSEAITSLDLFAFMQ